MPNQKSNHWLNFKIRVVDFASQRIIITTPDNENELKKCSEVIVLDDKNLKRIAELLTKKWRNH